jgi:hypothetical protein
VAWQPEVHRHPSPAAQPWQPEAEFQGNRARFRRQPEVQQRSVRQPEVATSSDPLVDPSERTKDSLCAARTLGAVVQRSALPEPDGFARFWAAWPAGQRKRGRKMALAAWQALHLEDQAAAIVADVERRRDHDDFWLRGYAPMPQTYLRGARWEDELTQAPPQRSPTPTR